MATIIPLSIIDALIEALNNQQHNDDNDDDNNNNNNNSSPVKEKNNNDKKNLSWRSLITTRINDLVDLVKNGEVPWFMDIDGRQVHLLFVISGTGRMDVFRKLLEIIPEEYMNRPEVPTTHELIMNVQQHPFLEEWLRFCDKSGRQAWKCLDFSIEGVLSPPLFIAASSNNYPAFEILLKHGASVTSRNRSNGVDVFNSCVVQNFIPGMLLLMSRPDFVGINTPSGAHKNTPLHWAVLEGHLDAVILLLYKGADHSLYNGEGQLPRELATSTSVREVLDMWRRTKVHC